MKWRWPYLFYLMPVGIGALWYFIFPDELHIYHERTLVIETAVPVLVLLPFIGYFYHWTSAFSLPRWTRWLGLTQALTLVFFVCALTWMDGFFYSKDRSVEYQAWLDLLIENSGVDRELISNHSYSLLTDLPFGLHFSFDVHDEVVLVRNLWTGLIITTVVPLLIIGAMVFKKKKTKESSSPIPFK